MIRIGDTDFKLQAMIEITNQLSGKSKGEQRMGLLCVLI